MTSVNIKQTDQYSTDLTKPETENETVFQLLYISAATHQFTEQELTELLTKARENNESLGISGMLLYHERERLQRLVYGFLQIEPVFS